MMEGCIAFEVDSQTAITKPLENAKNCWNYLTTYLKQSHPSSIEVVNFSASILFSLKHQPEVNSIKFFIGFWSDYGVLKKIFPNSGRSCEF